MQSLLNQFGLLVVATVIVGVGLNLAEYGRLQFLALAKSIRDSRDLSHAVIYLGTYAIASASIVVAVFSESSIVCGIALGLIFFFLTMDAVCRFVLGDSIGFNEVQTTLSESTFAGQFMSSHAVSIGKAVLFAGLVTGTLLVAAFLNPIRFELWWLLLVPLAAVLAYAVVWRTVAATDVYPAPIRIPVLFVYASLNALRFVPRQSVDSTPGSAPKPRVILLIMDESITGNYLSINGWPKETTPYLESIKEKYLNLGIACSASNISAATNIIIRSGLRADQIADREQLGLRNPSIFQYAQAAGYRTCYLDAQYQPGVRGNFLSQHDLASIDQIYWAIADEPDSNKRHVRDRLLANRILSLIQGDQPTFIWVNKYGAHIHFEQTYPDEARVFEPTMPHGRSINACALEEVQNSYANALRWSVDEFFRILVPAMDLADTAVVYTSDHGQSLEGGRGASTHADRVDPPVSQANVPMLCWGDHLRQQFAEGIDQLRDRTSHFQIFPSLLSLMGYEESDVTKRYGAPLWGPPPDRRVFLSGDIFGRGIVHINEFDQAVQSIAATPSERQADQ